MTETYSEKQLTAVALFESHGVWKKIFFKVKVVLLWPRRGHFCEANWRDAVLLVAALLMWLKHTKLDLKVFNA